MYAQPIQSIAQSLNTGGCSSKVAQEVTQSEVAAELARLRSAVDVLGERLGILSGRLQPVLVPTTGEHCPQATDSEPASTVGLLIRDQVRKVEAISVGVSDLLRSLAV